MALRRISLMTQIESTQSNRTRLPKLGMRRKWWKTNYHAFRLGIITPWKRILRYEMRFEGSIPNTRPVMLVPVHRTSIDIFAISHVAKDFISYVSTDDFGHNRLANTAQERLTSALGSIVWHENGMSNRRARAVALARDVEKRLDDRLIIAAFTQGEYQPQSVDTIEDGLIALLKRYEGRHFKQSGQKFRIPIVPVGLEYDLNKKGLVHSRFARRLADYVPLIPRWTVPAIGSKITVRFGTPHYLDDQEPEELTRTVMREAAALSNIPYNVL